VGNIVSDTHHCTEKVWWSDRAILISFFGCVTIHKS